MNQKRRIQIEVSDEAWKELKDLQRELKADTMSDAIKGSLKITKYVTEVQEGGKKDIIVRDRNTNQESKLVFVY